MTIPTFKLPAPATEQGRILYERAVEDYPEPWKSEVSSTVRLIEAEAVALTLDAAREHMGCACGGIEGHLAERRLLLPGSSS
jgi:hypothetical protein